MNCILFLNTTTSALQVAVLRDKTLFTSVGEAVAKRHNEVLLPTVDRLLLQAEVGIKELTHIVCVAGPGSFTGIRIGASFATALKRSTGAKLYQVTSLEIVGTGDRVVALDCKHDNFYTLTVKSGVCTYQELTSEQIAAIRLPRFDVADNTLNDLVRYGTDLVKSNADEVAEVRPFYLKKSSAERESEQKEEQMQGSTK